MSVQTSEYLKGKFSKGNYPTETDYSDLIDSCINTSITPGTRIILAPVGADGNYDVDGAGTKYIPYLLYDNSYEKSALTYDQTVALSSASSGTCIIVFNTLESEPIGIVVRNYYNGVESNDSSNPAMDTKQFIIAPGGSIMFVKVGMHYAGGYTPVVSMVGTAVQGNILSS